MTTVSRRDFLVAGVAAGGGLLIGCRVGGRREAAALAAAEPAVFAPNAFVRIGKDGRVTLVMAQVEMGQGVYTSLSMLIAEELEVGLDQVTVDHAPADDKLYANPLLGFQATGGSTSVRGSWKPLREAGATARTMLVAAAAQSWSVEPATCHVEKGMIIHGPSGRKLGYGEVAEKAAALPVPKQVVLKDPKAFTLIGTSARRLDGPDKVNGKAEFGIDVRLPGMKFATVAASPVLGGTVAGLDEARAMKVKGVRQVIRLDNAVAVVGDHYWAARTGLAELAVTWNDGANASATSADIVKQLETESRKPGVVARKVGDVAGAMAGAARKIEAVYQLPFLAHATMEPMNCTVHVRKESCEIWTGTQVATRAQAAAAEVTGLPLDKVTVHNHLLGGGFGRRLEVDYVTLAVRIAKQVDGPVKVVWTREEDMQHSVYRPYYYDRLSAGLNRAGKPVAWTHRVSGSSIMARWIPQYFQNGLDSDAVEGAAEPPYELPALLVDYLRVEPAGLVTGWWRGVGPTHNIFVVESFIDELAAATKTDPVQYRRALLGKNPRALAVLELAAKESGWGQPLPAGRGRGVSLQFAFGSYVSQVAEVEVGADGTIRVHRVVCAVDCGITINPDTVRAQMEGGINYGISSALFSQITLKDGRVEQANFNDYRALRIDEAPVIEVHLVPSTEDPGGIGEPGTSAVAPAVANAVHAATGRRIRKLPLQA